MVPKSNPNRGQLRGVAADVRLTLRTIRFGDCWLFGTPGDGYGKLLVDGRTVSAHRYAYELANGPIPDGMVVRHTCDTPRCVRPDHLTIGTHADNSRDMTERARQARGEAQGSAKVTRSQVIEARRLYTSGETQRHIAKVLGVSKSQVSNIVTGADWSHIPGAVPKKKVRRLSADDKAEVLALIAAGHTHAEVANRFGVTRSAISQVAARERRKN